MSEKTKPALEICIPDQGFFNWIIALGFTYGGEPNENNFLMQTEEQQKALLERYKQESWAKALAFSQGANYG